ncbi:hypothetical protein E3P78_02603 [Wallemia ichthyophaga]|nr:hypothetical protein E3P78_02603 [Wallemia ichthyophaga]
MMAERGRSTARKTSSGYGEGEAHARSTSHSASRSRSPSLSRSRDSRSMSRSPAATPRGLKCVCVRNLTKNVAVEHLEEIFDAYGKIIHVELARARKINTHMGYAFIFYEHVEDAEDACDFMDNGIIDEVRVNVDMSKMSIQTLRDRHRDNDRYAHRDRESSPRRRATDPRRDYSRN